MPLQQYQLKPQAKKCRKPSPTHSTIGHFLEKPGCGRNQKIAKKPACAEAGQCLSRRKNTSLKINGRRIPGKSAVHLTRLEEDLGVFVVDIAVDEHIMQIWVYVAVMAEFFQDTQGL